MDFPIKFLFRKRSILFVALALFMIVVWKLSHTCTTLHTTPSTAPPTTASPTGGCSAYSELQDVNFMKKSIRDSICNGVPAYTMVNSAFPMCELQQNLPKVITDSVKSGSFLSFIRNPLTLRNVTSYVYKSSDYISDIIRNSHIFEEGLVKSVMKLTQKLNALSPVTFVDIGSNIGVYTLPALDIGLPVVSLDANIRNLVRIRHSAEVNKFANKSRLVWNFISSRVGLMFLNFPENCNVGGATKFARASTDTIPVMSTTADSIASLIGTQTVVMKVDIEGGEAAFFMTATNLFNTFTIPIVHMEWTGPNMSDEERKFMIQFFTSRKYLPRNVAHLSTVMIVEDPKLACEDLVWVREDFLKTLS